GRIRGGVRVQGLSAKLYLCSRNHDRGGCMTLSPRALLPTPTTLRLAIIPVLAFLATVTDRNYLADFWHHLARGRAIVERGELVNHDLFTFTIADQPLRDACWLTQVGYHLLFEAGGLALVQVVNSLLVAVTLGWVVLLC